ncbi:MAG TPA: porin family protein [Blastocatellia bacterium]
MKRHILSMAAAVLSLTFLGAIEARAQSSDYDKVEVGGQFSFIHFDDLSSNDVGIGGRIGYNFADFLGVEAEANYFPSDKSNINLFTGVSQGGHKVDVLVGPKIGFHSDKWGIYGKFDLGAIHFSRDLFTDTAPGDTDFAFDFGGVIEYYPSKKTYVRLDLADMIFRIPGTTVNEGMGVIASSPAFYSHNFQMSLGVGVRF